MHNKQIPKTIILLHITNEGHCLLLSLFQSAIVHFYSYVLGNLQITQIQLNNDYTCY